VDFLEDGGEFGVEIGEGDDFEGEFLGGEGGTYAMPWL
jgi:hypothetical protein